MPDRETTVTRSRSSRCVSSRKLYFITAWLVRATTVQMVEAIGKEISVPAVNAVTLLDGTIVGEGDILDEGGAFLSNRIKDITSD